MSENDKLRDALIKSLRINIKAWYIVSTCIYLIQSREKAFMEKEGRAPVFNDIPNDPIRDSYKQYNDLKKAVPPVGKELCDADGVGVEVDDFQDSI